MKIQLLSPDVQPEQHQRHFEAIESDFPSHIMLSS